MRILLFGKGGQVGWELQRSLAPLGDVIAVGRDDAGSHAGNFLEPDALAETVRTLAPAVIVNAAAHTAVDQAESEPEAARLVNAAAPAILAREAASLGAWLLHFGTDYVFDGSGSTPWREDSPTGPLNIYGRTKLEGEAAIRASGCAHLILRTSWVYAARGNNFAKTMLRLAAERDRLAVVDDQVGAPTGAELIADVCAHVLRSAVHRPELAGTYHLAAAGLTSWYGYARHVIEHAQHHGRKLRATPDSINPVATSDFPKPARRPLNSQLDTRKLREAFDLELPPWQAGVDRMLDEILTRNTP